MKEQRESKLGLKSETRNQKSEVRTSKFVRSLISVLLLAIWLTTHSFAVETFTPEQEKATFQLADGFEVNLFAAEDLGVLNPMQMRWDDQGRLFVISTLGYPQLRPGEEPKDKIIMLEDTDQDGVADKSTVFVEGLNIPTGLEPGNGGLYVGEQTNLVFLKDTDGDGKADHREVVLGGFGVGDTHQAINSFVWSPGGELYFDQGDGIESRVETPWGLSGLFQAGVLRFRPKRLRLDPILDDFMGPGNPWGIVFDDWGQTFVVDGAGGVTFLSPAMMPVRHRKRLRQIGEAGGYCGVEVLGSEHLPEDFQGDFLLGDFQRMRIKRFAAVPNGAGFEVQWKEPLMVSTHRNFRPVDVRTGPDGAIYICDWYNSVICHQDDPFRHPDRDFTHGRIWRITNNNAKPIPRPRLHDASVEELLAKLTSPERWTRYQAKVVLADRDRTKVGKAVAAYWNQQRLAGRVHLLYELIGVLESVEVVNENMLAELLRSKNYRARAYAARVIGRWQDRMNNPLALLEQCARDEHPQVRMEAIVACAHVPSPHAAEVAAVASDFEVDYDIDYALTQSLHHLKELWVPAFQRSELSFGGSGNRIASVLQRVDSKELLTSVRRMAKSDDVSAATKLGITKTLAAIGSPKDLSLVLQAATNLLPKDNSEVLHALANAHQDRSVKPTGFDPLSSLIASKDSGVRMQAIELTGLWKVRSLTDRVVAIASDRHEQNEVRVAAIQALSNLGGEDAAKMLRRIASENGGQQVAAIRSLCRLDLETAVELTSQLLSKEPTLADAEYSELVDAFAGRKDGFAKLAAQIDGKTFSASTATKLLDALNGFGITDERLVSQLMTLANRSRSLPEYSEEFVAELVSEISKGDPDRGATLFHSKQANCTACHQVSGQGGVTGPDLSGVGTTLPKDRLVQEVLWPQRLVKEGYSLRQVITEDGEVLQGYVRKSRNKKVVLLRPLDSEKLISIPKDTIEFQQDIGSAMPENTVATLSPDERIDLLAFLGQLGTPDGFTGVANEVKVP